PRGPSRSLPACVRGARPGPPSAACEPAQYRKNRGSAEGVPSVRLRAVIPLVVGRSDPFSADLTGRLRATKTIKINILATAVSIAAIPTGVSFSTRKMVLDNQSEGSTIELSPPIRFRIEWADSQGKVTASWLAAHFYFIAKEARPPSNMKID